MILISEFQKEFKKVLFNFENFDINKLFKKKFYKKTETF